MKTGAHLVTAIAVITLALSLSVSAAWFRSIINKNRGGGGGLMNCACTNRYWVCNFPSPGRESETFYTCPRGFIRSQCGCQRSCQCTDCPEFDTTLRCENGYKTQLVTLEDGGSIECPISKCKH